MILQGNQRAGARNLALHLLKDENEHVDIHELRGFVSDDLISALNEVHAISKGTRAKQYLYSLSLNPPRDERVSTNDFEQAIEQVEERLNLNDQPRAIVFHEKEGRRHCHAVWSRIDSKEMKAIPLPHTKRKLMDLSRKLYVQHGWEMPRGMVRSQERDPMNFTLAQWQQAKRTGKDPRNIKCVFQDCWATSDNQAAFASALKSRGYVLARGDRRGFVALDYKCEVYAVSKWTGLKAKQVEGKLIDREALPSVAVAKEQIARMMMQQLDTLKRQNSRRIDWRKAKLKNHKKEMTETHRRKREALRLHHERRQLEEQKVRQDRFRKGLSGLWDRLTGKHRKIAEQNIRETHQSLQRDRVEKDKMIYKQLREQQALQQRMERIQAAKEKHVQTLSEDIDQFRYIEKDQRETFGLENKQDRDREILER